jgi:hypothetical protein
MAEEKKRSTGIKTSEFWLAAITSALSLAIIGGWIDIEGASTADKIAAMVAMALSSVGYTVGRSHIKAKAADAELPH